MTEFVCGFVHDSGWCYYISKQGETFSAKKRLILKHETLASGVSFGEALKVLTDHLPDGNFRPIWR